MDCATCRRILWPPDRPRLLTPETTAALAHRASCEACSDYLAQAPWMLDVLQDLSAPEAPATLRRRLGQRLREPGATHAERHLSGSGRFRPMVVGLALAATLALAWLGLGRGSDAETFAADYVRWTTAEQKIRSADQADVAAFIQAELGQTIRPVLRDGYRLLGAEICLLAGRRGVMLDYEAVDGALAHYIIPTYGAGPSTRPRLVSRESGTGMPHVVRWADRLGEHALVGHGDPLELLDFARQASGD